jgi:hypothetical protein
MGICQKIHMSKDPVCQKIQACQKIQLRKTQERKSPSHENHWQMILEIRMYIKTKKCINLILHTKYK